MVIACQHKHKCTCKYYSSSVKFDLILLQYEKTTFGSLATYWCQPGFKEPKNRKSSVTLRCDTEDSWIGLDFDRTTKAVCEPLTLVSMPWYVDICVHHVKNVI